MKTFKTLLPLLLILSVALTLIHISPVIGQGEPTLALLFPNGTNSSVGEYSAGETFTVDVYVTDMVDLFGFDITLKYDTAILTATQVAIGGFLLPTYRLWKNVIDDGAGFVWYAASQSLGETGVDGFGTLVSITFMVEVTAPAMLLLSNTKLSDSYGLPITHAEYIAFFENPPQNIAVSLDTGYVETHRWHYNKDADKLVTFTAQIKNMGTGITYARVRFTVLDSEGYPLWDLLSDDIFIDQSIQAIRVSTDLSPTQLINNALFDVIFAVEYIDGSGMWNTGHKGSPTGNRMMMIKSFTVEGLP